MFSSFSSFSSYFYSPEIIVDNLPLPIVSLSGVLDTFCNMQEAEENKTRAAWAEIIEYFNRKIIYSNTSQLFI